jgi:hypothetical protein
LYLNKAVALTVAEPIHPVSKEQGDPDLNIMWHAKQAPEALNSIHVNLGGTTAWLITSYWDSSDWRAFFDSGRPCRYEGTPHGDLVSPVTVGDFFMGAMDRHLERVAADKSLRTVRRSDHRLRNPNDYQATSRFLSDPDSRRNVVAADSFLQFTICLVAAFGSGAMINGRTTFFHLVTSFRWRSDLRVDHSGGLGSFTVSHPAVPFTLTGRRKTLPPCVA